MVFAAAFAANLYNGLNTSAWTGWVFFAVFIGNILIWIYTVSIKSIRLYVYSYRKRRQSTTSSHPDGLSHLYTETTISCSTHRTSGFVFPSLSAFPCSLDTSTRLTRPAFILTMSTFSDTSTRRSLTESSLTIRRSTIRWLP